MFKEKFIKKTNFYITLLMVSSIIIALNLFFSFFSFRIDLTKNKLFSISPVTKRILNNLEDIITIKVYFSQDLPGYLVDVREEVKDVLKEYQTLSKGKIKIKFLDPLKDEEIKNEALRVGIPPLQVNVVKEDKYEVAQVFLGMAIFFQDKKEVIPMVENVNSLEYDLTSRIKKITLEEVPKIAFIDDYGSLKLSEDLQILDKELSKQYQIESLTLKNPARFQNIKSIILAGLKEKINTEDLMTLKDLLQQGKNLIILQEGVSVDKSLRAEKLETGLNELLADFGIKLKENLIIDPFNSKASFSSGFIQFFIPYLYWPRLSEKSFNKENGMVNTLQNVTLPWVSSIDIEEKEGYKINILAQTSSKSELVENNFVLDPQQKPVTVEKSQGQHIVALHLSRNLDRNAKKMNVIVVADSDFIRDNFVSRFQENLIFFQNLVDGISLDEDLINIRSKREPDHPLKAISKEGRTIVKYLNIFGMSIIFCGIGLARYLIRRKIEPSYV